MKLLKLSPEFSSDRRLVFFLAMEEWAAANFDEAFFMWQSRPTVIFGRNQVYEAEVNIAYCREKGIEMYRRKSGGGCVYSDKGNIMISYITSSVAVEQAFADYLDSLCTCLRAMGVPAEKSGRNDVLVDGLKVSGNAFYSLLGRSEGRSIIHGTLLYDTCFENMVGAITPSEEKLRSKGVASVRRRVGLLKNFLPRGENAERSAEKEVGCIINSLASHFTDSVYELTSEDVAEIEKIEQGYLDPAFLYGNNPSCTLVREGRVEGAGTLRAEISLKHNRLSDLRITGDCFELKSGISDVLTSLLKNVSFTRKDFLEILDNFKAEEYIYKVKTTDLLAIIFPEG